MYAAMRVVLACFAVLVVCMIVPVFTKKGVVQRYPF